jgi:uncharacterized Fe-S radical SAM superfamily protein PflX
MNKYGLLLPNEVKLENINLLMNLIDFYLVDKIKYLNNVCLSLKVLSYD